MYKVKEIFSSIQGEGYWSGSPCTFIRFSGCNVWSGREPDRDRDSEKGLCARYCDTDFLGGELYDVAALRSLTQNSSMVVLTGGEPALQVDQELLKALHDCHIETNGSIRLPTSSAWVTLSPKPPMVVVDQRYDEVKVLFPIVDPHKYSNLATYKFIQPVLLGDVYKEESIRECLQFIQAHPEWRLSIQVHKLLHLR